MKAFAISDNNKLGRLHDPKEGVEVSFFSFLKHKFLILSLISILFSINAFGVSIFEVRRRVSLKNGEVTPKDYYINGGRESGLKPGMIVKVHRQQALYDSYQNKSPGDMQIPVGELKILYVQKGISVAREHSMFDRNKFPVLEDDYLMIGDVVDISSARSDKKNQSSQNDTSKSTVNPEILNPMEGSASNWSVSPDPVMNYLN